MIPSITSGVKLIGICGHAGSGKTTVTDFLINNYKDFYSIALADPLKEAASITFGIPLNWFYSPELKETLHSNWNLTPRQIAQFLGTEMFRTQLPKLSPSIGDDFWIQRAVIRINNEYMPEDEGTFDSEDTVVISDIRFQNEYDWIISAGGDIIHLTRPGATGNIGIPNHPSEAPLNLHTKERTYECVNDSSLEILYHKIEAVVANLAY